MTENIIDSSTETIGLAADLAKQGSSIFITPFQEVASKVLGFLPQLISALIVLIIGGIIVRVIVSILKKILQKAKIDNFFEKTGISREMTNVGITVPFSEILIKAINLFLKLIVWIAVIDVLEIDQLTLFINDITAYLPNVIVAIIILAVGLAVANVVKNLCEGAAGSLSITKESASTLGKIARFGIIAFSIMAVLQQLGVADSLIDTLFTGIIAALSIGIGISFGLGGKEKANEIISKLGR